MPFRSDKYVQVRVLNVGTIMTEKGPTTRKLLMTPRQIAVTAIFSALGMITTGMGLALPGYLPMVNFELNGTFMTICTMAAGPIGGLVASILISLVSAVGIVGAWCYWPHIFVVAAFYPAIWAMKSRVAKTVAWWVLTAVALFVQYFAWWWLYAAVFKIMTVQAMFYYNMFAGPYVVYLLIWGLIPWIILMGTPKFVRPEWKLPGTKIIAAVLAVISVVLALLWW